MEARCFVLGEHGNHGGCAHLGRPPLNLEARNRLTAWVLLAALFMRARRSTFAVARCAAFHLDVVAMVEKESGAAECRRDDERPSGQQRRDCSMILHIFEIIPRNLRRQVPAPVCYVPDTVAAGRDNRGWNAAFDTGVARLAILFLSLPRCSPL